MREQTARPYEFCRQERRTTRWLWIGGQNGDRPAADFYRCDSCDVVRIQAADVTDVEALCEHVVIGNASALLGPGGVRIFDPEEAAAELRVAFWTIYRKWDPDRVRETKSLRAYAKTMLRNALYDWRRKQLRRSGRIHASAESLSLYDGDGNELEGSLATLDGDPALRDLDVLSVNVEPTTKRVALLTYSGLLQAEIAAKLGISEWEVADRMRGFRAILRESLA